MHRRFRIRSALKCCGIATCLALLVLIIASRYVAIGFAGGRDTVLQQSGAWSITTEPGLISFRRPTPFVAGWVWLDFSDFATQNSGTRLQWWPRRFFERVVPWDSSGRAMVHVQFPTWIPLLFTAFPTAWLLWRDKKRRYPEGHCRRCGYNLRGLTLPRCPECSTTFDHSTVPEE